MVWFGVGLIRFDSFFFFFFLVCVSVLFLDLDLSCFPLLRSEYYYRGHGLEREYRESVSRVCPCVLRASFMCALGVDKRVFVSERAFFE